MKLRDVPNLISVLRILLVAPFIWALLRAEYDWALLLFVVAALSDALDGYLARRNQWFSRLGAILDPLADKLLLSSGYLLCGLLGLLPLWLALLVLARDLVIVVGAVGYHFLIGRYEMAPSLLSKLNTLTQALLLFLVLEDKGLFPLPAAVIPLAGVVVVLTTVLSGADYVGRWGGRAWREHLARRR